MKITDGMKLTSVIDVGESVVCDFCNDDFTESEETGGALIGSYAICPKCTAGVKHKEEIDICCPAGTQFRKWVLQLRGGDNTIKTYESAR